MLQRQVCNFHPGLASLLFEMHRGSHRGLCIRNTTFLEDCQRLGRFAPIFSDLELSWHEHRSIWQQCDQDEHEEGDSD